jgi:hypothetical protein
MARISGVLLAVGLAVATVPGCSGRSVSVGGVCSYQWVPGVPGADSPPPEPCPGLSVLAQRLSDGKLDEATTDPQGRFAFRLPPGRYRLSAFGRLGKCSGGEPPQPVEVEVKDGPVSEVRLTFYEFGK